MRFDPRGWVDMVRSLGEALIEVLGAEVGALRWELGESGRRLGVALLLLAIAAALLFWTFGALTLATIEVLALWLPRWGATLTTTGVLLILAIAIGAWGARALRRIEPPGETIRRRWEEHQSWWQGGVLAAGPEEPDAPAADDSPPGERS